VFPHIGQVMMDSGITGSASGKHKAEHGQDGPERQDARNQSRDR
jgi:hypothetical protein